MPPSRTARIAAELRAGAATIGAAALLGFAGRATLHAMDAFWYRLHPVYRSPIHNRRGLLAWEETALGSYFPPAGTLLVVGAGGGREVFALAARGYDITACECNAALLSVARRLAAEAGIAATFEASARDAAPEPDGRTCAGVIVGWSAYMLIPGAARRIALLGTLRRWLDDGAPVLLSFFTRRDDDPRLARIAVYGTALRRLFRRDPVQPGDDLAPTFVHRFTRAELAAEVEAAGFRLARFEEQGPGPEDSGWAVIMAVSPVPFGPHEATP
jgi:SAM-dependent methyltransferase